MTYTPQLISMRVVNKPCTKAFGGSVALPISGGGLASKSGPTGISFSKTGSYGWSFWIKFDADDNVYKQVILLGTLGTSGYRIVKDQAAGRNVICLQEVTTNYTVDRWYYPRGFDVTKWHHIVITWVGNSASSVTSYCFINGLQITSKNSSITWSNAVAHTGTVYLGYEWADHTLGGSICDVGFFTKLLYPDDVYRIMYRRVFEDAVSRWKCDDLTGNKLADSIGVNIMTMYNTAALQTNNPGWSYTRTRVTGLTSKRSGLTHI